jgi:hypothetical protein
MKVKSLLLALLFALTPLICAQDTQEPPPGPGGKSQAQTEHRQFMREMHKQEMEAMKADIEKMKASLAQMKANILLIKDVNEMARWRNNVDMWETLVGHMERMQKHMESMGPGMMGPRHMGDHPSPLPE